MSTSQSTVIDERLNYFSDLGADWWNPIGRFRITHVFQPYRRQFFLKCMLEKNCIEYDRDEKNYKFTKEVNVLDVGCGVGIISERMAVLGANVTAIDPSAELIETAKHHLKTSSPHLIPRLNYLNETIEDHLANTTKKYDTLVVFLITEHIVNKKQFFSDCFQLLKPGGSLIAQFYNINMVNWFWILWWHVNVTKIAPKNLAHYSQCSSTEELIGNIKSLDFKIMDVKGINMSAKGDFMYWTKPYSNSHYHFVHAIKP